MPNEQISNTVLKIVQLILNKSKSGNVNPEVISKYHEYSMKILGRYNNDVIYTQRKKKKKEKKRKKKKKKITLYFDKKKTSNSIIKII